MSVSPATVVGRSSSAYNDAPTPAVFFITTAGWPGNNTFIGMSFTDSPRTTTVSELFDFAGYAYAGFGGEPQSFSVIPHESGASQFFSDAIPSHADPIAATATWGSANLATPLLDHPGHGVPAASRMEAAW